MKKNNSLSVWRLLTGFFLIFAYSCTNMDNPEEIIERCPSDKIEFINNSTIKHSVVLMGCDTCIPVSTIGYRVIVQLPESELKVVQNLSHECWIRLLENENTDWAANLILYHLHNKDAILLLDNNSIDWKKYSKDKEIANWKKELP